jgi:hypothetical protein
MDRGQAMHPNVLPIFVGALALAFVILVYALYQQQQQLNELVIMVGDGVSIEKK